MYVLYHTNFDRGSSQYYLNILHVLTKLCYYMNLITLFNVTTCNYSLFIYLYDIFLNFVSIGSAFFTQDWKVLHNMASKNLDMCHQKYGKQASFSLLNQF